MEHRSPLGPLQPAMEFPSLSEAKKASRGRHKSYKKKSKVGPAPVQDLESHLRGMILSNGVPEGSESGHVKSGADKIAHLNLVPPHLRSAPILEQEAYLKKQGGKIPGTTLNVSSPKHEETVVQQASISENSSANNRSQVPQVSDSQDASRVLPVHKKLSQSQEKKLRTQQNPSSHIQGAAIVPKVVSERSEVASPSIYAPNGSVVQANPPSQQIRSHSRHHDRNHIASSQQNMPILPPQSSQTAYQRGNGPRHPPRQHQFNPNQQNPTRPYVQPFLDRPRQHQQYSTYHHAPPTPDRPRQLYDPSTNGMQRTNDQRFNPRRRFDCAPLLDQIDHLNQLATTEVPLAEISNEDLNAKERLRQILEDVCRDATSSYEQAKDPDFDPSTVALKCFGSLSSGFATRSSDMDLALISPASRPDPASTESEIPRLLEKTLLDMGYGARLLTRTRVPIIKFCEKPTTELTEALIQARLEWEKSKDFPPSPQKPINIQRPSENGANSLQSDQRTDVDETLHQTVDSSSNSVNSSPRPDKELARLYMLAISEDWFDDNERKVIFRFTTALKNNTNDSCEQNLFELTNAREALKSLPDVLKRYREKHEDPLNFPKHGVGIQCDINFSNLLALHNTHLLRCYALCDPRIRPMVLFVKTWAKCRKINSPYHGTLSSYGYVLMVLHFVINVADPPLAPNLQLSRRPPPRGSDPKVSDTICEGCDVRFWRSEREIKDCVLKGTLMPDRNHESIGSLLRNFFNYFAHQGPNVFRCGFAWTQDVLSLRTPGGRLTKVNKGWTGAKTVTVESKQPGHESTEIRHRYLLCIEDPFEIEHNIGRTVVHNGIVAIRDEFRRAHRIILHAGLDGGTPVYLFEEAKDPPLQRSYFGPKPRPEFGPENLAEHLRPGVSPNNKPALRAKTSQEFTGCLSPVSKAPSDLEEEDPVPVMELNQAETNGTAVEYKKAIIEPQAKLGWYGQVIEG